jgi:putative sterol carrier protein
MADLTVQNIFTETLPEKLQGNSDVDSLDAVYQFDIEGDDGGSWVVDFTKQDDRVSEGETDDFDCKIEMSDQDFIDLWNGELPGPQAFMMGKINVEGDMGLAMKLQKFIG